MKLLLLQLVVCLAFATSSFSESVGLCLHSNGPDAPAEKVECFEYLKVETASGGYRFFTKKSGNLVINKYRFRGSISYKDNLLPGTPDFTKTLKLYEDTATKYPSTRYFLNPKIITMRTRAAENTAQEKIMASLPKINISGKNYTSPKYKSINEGKLVITHRDGIAKFDIDSITDPEMQSLIKADPAASQIKVVEISGSRIWNPSFENLASGSVNIRHGKGMLALEFEEISEKDKKEIMSWSDGSWKIEKPGYYSPNPENLSYGEIVLESGKFHTNVQITERSGNLVTLKTSQANLKLPIRDLAVLPGLTKDDSLRLDTWVDEIVDERIARATPEETTQVLDFDEAQVLRVTDVRVKILQVLDEGVLASGFIGKLNKGTQTVKTTTSVTVEHPVSGDEIIKILNESTDKISVIEDVSDELCYIVGNTSNLVDGEIVTAESMTLLGRYQYISVAGAERSVRKYHVD
jgi:hypothetical protein